MGSLAGLLATDRRQALDFFALRLYEVSGPAVDREELLYNASVLAHHALISTQASLELSTPADLGAVFDHFVLDTSLRNQSAMMEHAGAQCLILTGFFEEQMRRRHNIRWYAELGAGFFRRAAAQTSSSREMRLFNTLAKRFELWRERYARLHRELRETPYLL